MTRPFDQSTLDSQLDSYAGTVTSYQASCSWKDRLGAWSAYAAVSGSALALATSANASIIYSGIQNISVSVPEIPGNRYSFKQIFTNPTDPYGMNFSFYIVNSLAADRRSAFARFENFAGAISTFAPTFARNRTASQSIVPAGHFLGAARLRRLLVCTGIYCPPFSFYDTGEFLVGQSGFAAVLLGAGRYARSGWIRFRIDDTNSDGFSINSPPSTGLTKTSPALPSISDPLQEA